MMKRLLTITIFLSTFIGNAFSATDDAQMYDEIAIDDRFVFDNPDFDPTTAFINLDWDNSAETSRADVDDIIAYAKKYLGRPYSRGSKGPKAFDCSGFTSFVFRNFDINLSPSSRTQATQGEKVSKGDVRPGDLLFFTGRSGSAIGHVALAIDVDDSGDITFIHAATGGIRIDRLSREPYYQKRYVCARRVL